jgi:uncharacterized protein (TIGR03435 family)
MGHLSIKIALVVAVIATAVMPVASQAPPPKPSFEVVSIKPTKSGGMLAMPPVMMGTRLLATNVTLKDLLFFAYSPPSGPFLYDQIIGGPIWTDSDHLDIEAQAKGVSNPISRDEMRVTVQDLLEDRFRLKVHRETREMPVLDLVVGESGLKMKLSGDQTPPTGQTSTLYDSSGQNSGPLPHGAMRVSTNLSATIITGNAVPISQLASALQGQSARMVFDKTDRKELFDFNLRFSSQGAPSLSPGPSLFAAIQELGLKLEASKAPLDVLVIDSVQKPSEN